MQENRSFVECLFSEMDVSERGGSLEIITLIGRIADEMPGGFFIYRANGDEELIYANTAMLRIFNCNTLEEFRELTGNSFRGIVHPEDLEAVEESIWKQIEKSQYDLDYVEYRIIQKGGEIRWIEDYGHFITNVLDLDFHSSTKNTKALRCNGFWVLIFPAISRNLPGFCPNKPQINPKETPENQCEKGRRVNPLRPSSFPLASFLESAL